MEYRELSIRIDRDTDGSYDVTASDGIQASRQQSFIPPFALAELSHSLPGVAATVAGGGGPARDIEVDADKSIAPLVDLKHHGRALFNALITDQIEFMYAGLARNPSDRIRIRISVGSSDAELTRIAALPWELLVSPNENDLTLALSNRHSIVRSLALPMPIDDVEIPRPLRILFVRSNPRGSTPLALDRERDAIAATWLGALDTEIVDVAPTRDALREQLDTRQFHVLHYMGHGGFSQVTGDGALKLEHEDGTPDLLYADELRVMVADRGLRLVFLNACKTGTTSMGDVDDAFGGLAAALIAAGVPAVIANQFPISDTPAIEFAETFYTHIVGGAPVDAAVTAGRQRLFRVQNSEWATPVLYMRSRSGMVLRMQPHRARAVEAGAARGFTVFLAATSPSMDAVRTGLADALRTLGVQVRGVEAVAAPAEAAHDAEVRAQVSAADLTVHLLDADSGAPLATGQALVPGVPNTLPLRQLVLATQSARSQLLLYEGPMDAATIADARYAAYFEALIRRTRDERRFEVASTPRSRMKDAILARLAVLSPDRSVTLAPAESPALAGTSINRVYIDVHSSDVDRATPLLRALRERELSVVLGGTVSTGTPASRLQSAEEAVSRADLVVLVFGAVAAEWAEQRFRWLDQLLSRLELQTRIAIFTPEPKAPAELRFNSRTKYPVFDAASILVPASLDRILEVQ